jgi:hypothetical protein
VLTGVEPVDGESTAPLRSSREQRRGHQHAVAAPTLPGPRFRPDAGLRSGAAARKDAELVPLWVGKTDPALIAGLADVCVPGA